MPKKSYQYRDWNTGEVRYTPERNDNVPDPRGYGVMEKIELIQVPKCEWELKDRLEQTIAEIWALLWLDKPDDARELARQASIDELRDKALAELESEDDDNAEN